ncbi:alpha/beta fold hydrolase [Sphingomonas immobilis]|uniref:Alpha/beta fold hydrolase n=1 Tax=Sphingomonas immobilis TaxID=3063997 RepID=A0ABT8ZXL8_9SPHN|nr:alpha/beta fold hydrolase [Sphingomonas sp. CA1-15]MDO7842293.1 alpha/beta fold hydrolase [Sphingomonas sp. CA1-15]
MADRQPLVLLSGVGGDEAVWEPLVRALADVADCRPMVAAGDSIAAMADDILARCDGPFALAGHSLGGYVALAIQRAAPARVTRLALLNTSAQADDADARANREKVIARIARDGFDAVVRLMAPATTASPMAEAAAMLLRSGGERFVREQRAAMTRPDALPGLSALAVPLLVVGSARDAIIPAARSVEIADAVPGATLVMLPDAGHLAPLEAPAAVAAAMRAWLAAA